MKKVLVTGATGSIGEEIVKEYAKNGFFVYIAYNSNHQKAQALLEEINNTHYDLIILDEINVAMYYDLITKETLEFVLNQIPSDIEIVCTGRYAPQWLCERADLVTDMQEVKHYYQQGLQGRKGIEN